MEHRCGFRRPVEVNVTIRTRGGVVGQGTLCEVSASGTRLRTSLPLATHSVVILTLSSAERGRVSQRPALEAEVVRQTATGFALEWAQFAPAELRWVYEQESLRKSCAAPAPTGASRALIVRNR